MDIFDFFQKQKHLIGDTVQFGKYFFKNEKDVQPIEWIVLDDNNGELLMLSKYCLDVVHYFDQANLRDIAHAVVWENSYMRNWLNDEFYNRAFTEKEKKRIVETVIVTDETLDPALRRNKLFLLSEELIDEFLPDQEKRIGSPTPYARQQGAGAGINTQQEAVWWWVMPKVEKALPGWIYPGILYKDEVHYHSRLVGSHGSYHATVRPAIKIKK